jgi:hypothetical protein
VWWEVGKLGLGTDSTFTSSVTSGPLLIPLSFHFSFLCNGADTVHAHSLQTSAKSPGMLWGALQTMTLGHFVLRLSQVFCFGGDIAGVCDDRTGQGLDILVPRPESKGTEWVRH